MTRLASQATGAALHDDMGRCGWVGLLLLAQLQHCMGRGYAVKWRVALSVAATDDE